MTNHATAECITPDDLVGYFEGMLSEDRRGLIETHFADCDACTELARRWHTFSEVFDSWTVRAHGEAYLGAAVERAIQKAQEQERVPALRERLTRWREDWRSRAEAAVRVIFESPGKAARVVTEGLETVIRPGGLWQFDLAPASVKVLGATRTRGHRKAAPTVALAQGTSQARVAVTSAISEIEVRVDEWPAGQDPPLVLLVPTQEEGAPRVQEPKRLPGTQSLIARFENVEAGDYLVAFEPLKRASA